MSGFYKEEVYLQKDVSGLAASILFSLERSSTHVLRHGQNLECASHMDFAENNNNNNNHTKILSVNIWICIYFSLHKLNCWTWGTSAVRALQASSVIFTLVYAEYWNRIGFQTVICDATDHVTSHARLLRLVLYKWNKLCTPSHTVEPSPYSKISRKACKHNTGILFISYACVCVCVFECACVCVCLHAVWEVWK